jgi:ubiquinone/menaquinone biosynthesis C-methylase UbiE
MPAQQVSIARKSASSFVHRHRWLPTIVAITVAVGFAAAIGTRINGPMFFALGTCSAVAIFAWGYSTHSCRQHLWAPLNHLSRRQYAEVWDSMMDSKLVPRVAETDVSDDEDLGPSTALCLENLTMLAEVSIKDDVLEIGCGAGRIGIALAPRCRSWVGADISARILARASERLSTVPNARLVQLSSVSLVQFKDKSFDAVYCTSVFGHLDEMDRWRYIQEAFRVLRPGGRLLVDNIDVESDAGWRGFLKQTRQYQELERPPFMPRFSTAAELTNYAVRAGFGEARVTRQGSLLVVTATKGVPSNASAK